MPIFLAVDVKEGNPKWSIGIQATFSQEFLHCVEAHTRANAAHAAANFLSSLRWKLLSFPNDKTLSMPGQLLLPVNLSLSSTLCASCRIPSRNDTIHSTLR